MTISVGDLVSYKAGRGVSQGRVASITDGGKVAKVSTGKGKLVYRAIEKLTLVEAAGPVSDVAAASVETPLPSQSEM